MNSLRVFTFSHLEVFHPLQQWYHNLSYTLLHGDAGFEDYCQIRILVAFYKAVEPKLIPILPLF